jgi:hypothetical protein
MTGLGVRSPRSPRTPSASASVSVAASASASTLDPRTLSYDLTPRRTGTSTGTGAGPSGSGVSRAGVSRLGSSPAPPSTVYGSNMTPSASGTSSYERDGDADGVQGGGNTVTGKRDYLATPTPGFVGFGAVVNRNASKRLATPDMIKKSSKYQ